MLPWFGRRHDSSANQSERRRSQEEPRWNLSHPLAVLKVVGEQRTLLGYAENLSRRGMKIGSICPKAVGSCYEVEFALPEPEDFVVRCGCRVVWSRPYSKSCQAPGMGLEFLDLPEELAARIESTLWRAGRPSRDAAMRIWSDFDRRWIRWRPAAAHQKEPAPTKSSPADPGAEPTPALTSGRRASASSE